MAKCKGCDTELYYHESDGLCERCRLTGKLSNMTAERDALKDILREVEPALLAALNVLDDWGFMEEAQLCHDALHKLRPISAEATGGDSDG